MRIMKKNVLFKGISMMMVFASLFLFVNCEGENALPETDPVVELLESGEMKGVLKENYTLDAGTSYRLTGQFIVDGGATLTIPAVPRSLPTHHRDRLPRPTSP